MTPINIITQWFKTIYKMASIQKTANGCLSKPLDILDEIAVKAKEAIECIEIESESQELDEAAEKESWDWACENKLDPYSMGQAYCEGFKAGAKWMAEQGISITAYIRDRFDDGYLSLVMPNNIDNRYKDFSKDDKVIVQIRKKDE